MSASLSHRPAVHSGTPSANAPMPSAHFSPRLSVVSDGSGIAIFNKNTVQVNGTSDDNSSGTLSPAGSFGPFSYSVIQPASESFPRVAISTGPPGKTGPVSSFFYVISRTKAV